MSVRKDKNWIPSGSATSSAQRNHNANLTVRPSATSNCRSRLNMTTCVAAPAPNIDWGLQCDLVYGSYLQTLMTRQLLTETLKQHTTSMNDQLSLQTDLLEKQIIKKHTLEEEIEKLELQAKLQNLLEVLHALLNHVSKNLDSEMEGKLNSVIKAVENACDDIYLKQVKPLESQQDCEELEKLLEQCSKNLQKVITVCGDVDLARQLKDCLGTFKSLHDEITKVQDSIVNLEGKVQSNTLLYVSEKLAAYRGYD